MGDGILAVFESEDAGAGACRSAGEEAQCALSNLEGYNVTAAEGGREAIDFVIGIDFGAVTFGNIGTPDRLDFTVVGQAVNVASRVQELCKRLDEKLLVTRSVAQHLPDDAKLVGSHVVRGVADAIGVYKV